MILKLQVSAAGDTAFPRDRFVITPHFQLPSIVADADDLCEDLATAMDGWMNDKREITVKAYDAEGTAPVFPIGDATVSTGLSPASTCPREVAICLSFFSGQNVPRKRGRLYIPKAWRGGTAGVRPGTGDRDACGALATILADLGGVDVDWVVYSRSDGVARPVSNWWVDDEWDTMRSRGLRATTRTQGTVSEQQLELVDAACVSIDWTDAATAVVAAIVAAGGTVAAKRRPAGSHTRVTDYQLPDDLDDLTELRVWEGGHAAEPLAGWPPPRARSRLRRAADELRGKSDR